MRRFFFFGGLILLSSVALADIRVVPLADVSWTKTCSSFTPVAQTTTAFSDHEKLTYSIRWGIISAGKGTIAVNGIETIDGRKAYHLSMELKTTGLGKSLHKYSDVSHSWMDSEWLLPLRYAKETRQKNYERDERVTFDWPCQRYDRTDIRIDKNKTETNQDALNEATLDILSYLFYLRSLPLEVGKQYDLTLMSGDHLWPVSVKVAKKAEISSPSGWVKTFYIEPSVRQNLPNKKLRKIQVWLSADERKIPIRFSMELNVGSITAELTSAEPKAVSK